MNQITDLVTRLTESGYQQIEVVVSDMAGIQRGKLMPLDRFSHRSICLPLAIFHQTISGDFHEAENNPDDRDMLLSADPDTARIAPWARAKTASVIADCSEMTGEVIEINPRQVLKRVIERYRERGWQPVVAPEVEFYLMDRGALDEAGDSPPGKALESAMVPPLADPYGLDQVHELGEFFHELRTQCEAQDIALGAISQEMGAGQYEVNFRHGNPLTLADDLCRFKRTIKALVREYGMRVIFLARPDAQMPGSSLHLHQSVCNSSGHNIFSDENGDESEQFHHFIGGLQRYLPDALLLLAPYANSYRRYLSSWSAPINLEWGVDNRTAGLRVPRSGPAARRVENRIAGSDVNPYLAIAGSLACGWLGLAQELDCRAPVKGCAYQQPFTLHRHTLEAIDALRASDDLGRLLGETFVTTYTAVKETEYREFQERVQEWERNDLMRLL